jgi:hypothetical protein
LMFAEASTEGISIRRIYVSFLLSESEISLKR